MNGYLRAAIIAISFGLFALPAAAADAIDGTYVDSRGYIEIRIGQCGNSRCGEISRIIRTKPGVSLQDQNNGDPTLRNRPILGVRLLSGLSWRNGAWRGEVYNPEDGKTYRAEVRPRPNGSLEVKGCVAIICRTRIWPAA